jgi:hypothetical protein
MARVPRDLVGADAGAQQVQVIEHDAAIARARSAGNCQHVIERRRTRKLHRQHLEQDVGSTLGGLTAQRGKRFRHLGNAGPIISKIRNLDMPGA